MRLLVVTEFAGSEFDGLILSVCREIPRQYDQVQVLLLEGFLKKYHYGGLRPSRLLNYAGVYLKMLWHVGRYRPDVILSDSTPPLLQLWAGFWGPVFGARTYAWIMDYHPEIEARYFGRRKGFQWLSKLLRSFDRKVLRRLDGVITLDDAMAEILREHGAKEVKTHPTWTKQGTGEYQPVELNTGEEEFRLAYVGNLGVAHGLHDLEALLRRVRAKRRIRLLVVGGNENGFQRLSEMSARLGASVEREGRLEWDALHSRLSRFRANYALVLLDEDKSGLLSPSKYATYIQLGLPILYVGPKHTNVDVVCREMGAGIAFTRAEINSANASLVETVIDSRDLLQRRETTRVAHDHLCEFNEKSFVRMLEPWLAQMGRPQPSRSRLQGV